MRRCASKTGSAEETIEWAVPVNEHINKQADEQMVHDLTRRFDMFDQFLPQVKGRNYVRSGQSSLYAFILSKKKFAHAKLQMRPPPPSPPLPGPIPHSTLPRPPY